ncbi:MAG: hypothetical protein NXI24_22960 [bacterium]|nr:hypothetical protein [bacterium]
MISSIFKFSGGGLLPSLLVLCLITVPACFNHPVVGVDELARYLGQGADEDDELDPEILALLAAAGGGGILPVDIGSPGTSATQIHMFQNGPTAGAIGGLAAANTLCDTSRDKPAGTTAVAFLSSDTQDLISLAGVPTAVPVVGPNATVISTSWAGLFDGGIEASVFAAGVVASGTAAFFTGTDGGGLNIAGTNCSNWTSGTGDSAVGRGNDVTAIWMNWDDPTSQCAVTQGLLCVAW